MQWIMVGFHIEYPFDNCSDSGEKKTNSQRSLGLSGSYICVK